MPKPLNLIVACAENRVIGRGGKLPWHIPEDLKFFHDKTAGQICVLGRVCFETWPRAALDGRRPVVITSRPLVAAGSGRSLLAGDSRHVQSTHHDNRLRAGSYKEHGHQEVTSQPRAVRSLDEALALADSLPGEIYVCGGQRIYEETLDLAGVRPLRLHLTLIHAEVPGDRFFPKWRHLAWREVARRESADANFRYAFLLLER